MGRRAKNKQGDPAPLDESVFLNRINGTKRKPQDESQQPPRKKSRHTPDVRHGTSKSKSKAGSKLKDESTLKKKKGKATPVKDSDGWDDIPPDEFLSKETVCAF